MDKHHHSFRCSDEQDKECQRVMAERGIANWTTFIKLALRHYCREADSSRLENRLSRQMYRLSEKQEALFDLLLAQSRELFTLLAAPQSCDARLERMLRSAAEARAAEVPPDLPEMPPFPVAEEI